MIKINYKEELLKWLPKNHDLVLKGTIEYGDLVFDLDKKFDVEPINQEWLNIQPEVFIEEIFYGVARFKSTWLVLQNCYTVNMEKKDSFNIMVKKANENLDKLKGIAKAFRMTGNPLVADAVGNIIRTQEMYVRSFTKMFMDEIENKKS